MSTLKTNIIKNTDDVEMYLAKAWVNFNGTGTVAIRAAGNVSSITDNGTGDYTVNFIAAMFDNNYAISVAYGTTVGYINTGGRSENGFQIETYGSTGSAIDRSVVLASVFR